MRAGPKKSAYMREYNRRPEVRERNSLTASERSLRYQAKMRQFLNVQKSVPCADCGVQYPPYVMDFDHVRGVKKFDISKMISRKMVSVLEEIEKCDVVCSNCHRMRTHYPDNRPVEE